jgi:hypothetical protein
MAYPRRDRSPYPITCSPQTSGHFWSKAEVRRFRATSALPQQTDITDTTTDRAHERLLKMNPGTQISASGVSHVASRSYSHASNTFN